MLRRLGVNNLTIRSSLLIKICYVCKKKKGFKVFWWSFLDWPSSWRSSRSRPSQPGGEASASWSPEWGSSHWPGHSSETTHSLCHSSVWQCGESYTPCYPPKWKKKIRIICIWCIYFLHNDMVGRSDAESKKRHSI